VKCWKCNGRGWIERGDPSGVPQRASCPECHGHALGTIVPTNEKLFQLWLASLIAGSVAASYNPEITSHGEFVEFAFRAANDFYDEMLKKLGWTEKEKQE